MAADGYPVTVGNYSIRPVRPGDLAELALLFAAHAEYERATRPPRDLVSRLHPALFATRPRLWCLVVHTADELVGYLSYTLEFSTWEAAEFVHLDCLYLAGGHRAHGVGAKLLECLLSAARQLRVGQVQWQTPAWNADAVRFYDRSGAHGANKIRYTLHLDGGPAPPR